ncbi:MAG TPA: hypothetical protein VNX18_00515 [Bryobacteraceae bacterium]|nr:hypothetical protein [Bryobacteraceae bacterium]
MNDLVTVYRSADEDAQEDAADVAGLLKSEGIEATLLDHHARGVPEGAWEVHVRPADVARAETLIAGMAENGTPDQSHDLDLVTVYQSGDGSSEGEMEALSVKSVLEAAGIEAILIGGEVPIPSLGQVVKVARDQVAEARRVIAEAQVGGPKAAEDAEAESESSTQQ